MRDAQEEEQFQMAMAKRRILTAAGALDGLIGDPGEFLLTIIEWGKANGFEDDAALLQRDWAANYGGVKWYRYLTLRETW